VSVVRDRVKETTTTTGTGSITLAGAATGYRSFNSAFGTGVRFYYAIASSTGSEWELGEGYLSGSTTLVRDVVLSSSNSGALVNFSAGTNDVFCTIPATQLGSGRSTAVNLKLTLGY
jgi:hypothetical protein